VYIIALELRVLAGARDKASNLRRLFVVLWPTLFFVEPLSIVKNRRLRSTSFAMNLFKVTI
jgi:hypothetical protein